MEVEVNAVTEQDIDDLLANMREADVREVKASTKLPAGKALRISVRLAEEVYACRVNGELAAIYGVGKKTILSTDGVPWLLGTHVMEQYPVLTACKSRRTVRLWRLRYPYMRNFVHVENTLAITWLKWLGFELHEPIEYGVNGELFYPFDMRT